LENIRKEVASNRPKDNGDAGMGIPFHRSPFRAGWPWPMISKKTWNLSVSPLSIYQMPRIFMRQFQGRPKSQGGRLDYDGKAARFRPG
jgi:hypothetical protein